MHEEEIIDWQGYLQKKIESIEIATPILNEEDKPVGLSYPNKTARDKDHKRASLNGKAHKDQSTLQKNPDETFNLEDNLVCRHLAYLKSHQARRLNGSNRGLNLDEIIALYKEHGDWDQKRQSYSNHPIHFLMANQLGAALAIIAENMVPDGPPKSLLLSAENHMMHINMQYKKSTDEKPNKKSTDEKPNRIVLNFWDPNSSNQEIRVVTEKPSDLQFIEFKHTGTLYVLASKPHKEQSIITIQDLSSIEQLTIPLFPQKTTEQKENFITALCVVSKDGWSGVFTLASKAPEELRTILGFVKNEAKLQKKIITALCALNVAREPGLSWILQETPEQLRTILGFAEDNTELQKKIITALCIVCNDGWSGLRLVAIKAPEQLQTILGFVENNTELKKNIITALCIVSKKDGWSGLRIVATKAPGQLQTILSFATTFEQIQSVISGIFISSTNKPWGIWAIEHTAKCKPTIVYFISFLIRQASSKLLLVTENTELQKIITDHLKELKSFEPKKIRKLLIFLDAINKSDNLDGLHDKLSGHDAELGVARKTTRHNLYGLFTREQPRTASMKVVDKIMESMTQPESSAHK